MTKVDKNLGVWLTVFGIWSVFESAIRIQLFHDSWNISSSLSFMTVNLICASILSLIAGIFHTLLLFSATFSRKWEERLARILQPASGIAFATLLVVLILLNQRQFLTPFRRIGFSSNLIFLAIIPAVYFLCLNIALLIPAVLRKKMAAHTRLFVIFLLLTPPVFVFATQGYRNSRFAIKREAIGPIRSVVLISIDTLRHDYVGAYGGIPTPVMDRVASEGVFFEVAISSIPQTGPSHISMFTGDSPLQHGVRFNGQRLPRRSEILTRQLREAGFHTAGFISGLPLKTVYCGLDQGFQRYSDRLATIDFISENFMGRMLIPLFARGYFLDAPQVTDLALQWLDKNSDNPFFVFVHYFDVHYPYGEKARKTFRSDPFIVKAKPEDLPRQKRLYAEEVQTVDSQIGRVIDFLSRRGIYEKTLVIITADHGESLGEHNYYYDHDKYVYEQLIRVPLILRCPPLIKPATVVKEEVAILDVYKTILDAVGVKPKTPVGGYNLIHLSAGIPANYNKRTIMSHSFYFKTHGIRTNRWKFIKRRRSFELYDLFSDPAEQTNLAQIKPAQTRALHKEMSSLFALINASGESWSVQDLSPEQMEDLKSLGYFN